MNKIKSIFAQIALCATAIAMLGVSAYAEDDITTIYEFINEMSADQQYAYSVEVRLDLLNEMDQRTALCVASTFRRTPNNEYGAGLVFMKSFLVSAGANEAYSDTNTTMLIGMVMDRLSEQCEQVLQAEPETNTSTQELPSV